MCLYQHFSTTIYAYIYIYMLCSYLVIHMFYISFFLSELQAPSSCGVCPTSAPSTSPLSATTVLCPK